MSNIVSFEQAKRLQELGISIVSGCGYVGYTKSGELVSRKQYASYKGYQVIPSWIRVFTISEALDWIREQKETSIKFYVQCHYSCDLKNVAYQGIITNDAALIIKCRTSEYLTHPLAESALLDAILTYLEEKK